MLRNICLFVLLGLSLSGACSASSIGYERVTWRALVAHTVTVDLADPRVRVSVALASGGAGRAEGFRSIMNRTRPAAAITGTFFDTRTLHPTGDIALFGTLVHSGSIGSGLCVDASNKATIVPFWTGRKRNWSGYETVLCAGPTLVAGGKVGIELKHEGFRRSLMSGSRRTAVGITQAGKLLLVAVNRKASLYDLAKLMIKLRAKSAVCLDGGSSTALYHQGGYFAVPGRALTNCLVVYSSVEAYNRAKYALAPARLLVRAPAKAASHAALLLPALLLPPDDLFPPSSPHRR